AVRFLRAEHEGRVTAVEGTGTAAAAAGVVAVTTGTAAGRTVRITHSFQDRLACVVATGPDVARAAERATAATRLITVHLDPPAKAPEPHVPEASHSAEEGVGGR
ncbi:hypothetical protein G3M58_81365, partial [Streptomyces sp. SID7499]|nr:hypothetical protein [Streptomyces sp. SID7499]